jgi:hypothetical protein
MPNIVLRRYHWVEGRQREHRVIHWKTHRMDAGRIGYTLCGQPIHANDVPSSGVLTCGTCLRILASRRANLALLHAHEEKHA